MASNVSFFGNGQKKCQLKHLCISLVKIVSCCAIQTVMYIIIAKGKIIQAKSNRLLYVVSNTTHACAHTRAHTHTHTHTVICIDIYTHSIDIYT